MVLLKEWRKEDKLILFELPQNNYGSGNHLHDLLAELKLSVPYVFNNHDRTSKGGFGNSGSAEHWSPISKIKKGERRKQDDLVSEHNSGGLLTFKRVTFSPELKSKVGNTLAKDET